MQGSEGELSKHSTTHSIEKEQQLREMLENDPLFDVIKDTSLEEILFGEEYLYDLEEKLWYSTPEVAEWFGINDGQLRYYIKPFNEYLFDEDSPTTSTAFRLNVTSILKLRMILLLKDKYRVKGLQRLIGLDGEGYVQSAPINTKATKEVSKIDNTLEQEVAFLKSMMEHVLGSGLFEFQQGEEGPEIKIKEDYLANLMQEQVKHAGDQDGIKLLQEQAASITKENQELKELIEKTSKANQELKESLERLEKDRSSEKGDVAIQIREKQIESELRNELRLEAVKEWTESNKQSFFSKLFQADRIELEKESFIHDYIKKHLNDRLTKAINEYRVSENK